MPNIQTRIGNRRTSAHFRIECDRTGGSPYPIPRVHQIDEHSCGFLAALTVVRYYDPSVPTRDVLEALMPSPTRGCSQQEMIRALKRFEIKARYFERLSWGALRGLADGGSCIIVTVQPEEWVSDHWTVVRGIEEWPEKTVILSNPAPTGYDYKGLDKDGSMSWRDFNHVWWPRGAALVCSRRTT